MYENDLDKKIITTPEVIRAYEPTDILLGLCLPDNTIEQDITANSSVKDINSALDTLDSTLKTFREEQLARKLQEETQKIM